jgi:hypothetical protein
MDRTVTCALVIAAALLLCVFLAKGTREHYTDFDPNEHLINATAAMPVREKRGRAKPFSDTPLYGILFGKPGIPFMLYDATGGNMLSARVNPAHPAAFVFDDLARREADIDGQSRSQEYRDHGVYFNSKTTVDQLWGNIFHGRPPTSGQRVVFKKRVKKPQMLGFLQRVAILVKRSEDLWPEQAQYCRGTSADVLSSQQGGEFEKAKSIRKSMEARGCDAVANFDRLGWLLARVQALKPVIWLDAKNYAGGVWKDTSGNGNDVTQTKGLRPARQEAGTEGASGAFDYVSGGVSAGLKIEKGWPQGQYTFVHVSKYDGYSKKRIWQGASGNWLNGHHEGQAGRAHHNHWIVSADKKVDPSDWLLGVATTKGARFNQGVASYFGRLNRYSHRVALATNPGGLAINDFARGGWVVGERSDFGVAEAMVFDRVLTPEEIVVVEEYLVGKLSLTFSAPQSGRQDVKGWTDSAIKMASKPDMCMDVSGYSKKNGGKVHMWKCHRGANQAWTYMPDTKQLRDKNSGRCLDLPGGRQTNGNDLQIWSCDPRNDNQKWEVVGDGILRKPGTDKCVDVSGGSTSNGAKIQLWDCHGGAAQRFQLPT